MDSEKKPTLAELQQEFTSLCGLLGQLHYHNECNFDQMEKIEARLKVLDAEAGKLIKKEKEADVKIQQPSEVSIA
jgi:hypothetical protein